MKNWGAVASVGRIGILILCAILGMVSIGYGIRVKGIGSGSTFYRIWYLIGACFWMLGLAVFFRLPGKLPVWLRIGVLTLLVIGVLIFSIIEILIVLSFTEDESEACDYLIVAGAQIRGNEPSVILRNRLVKAESYLKSHPETICIVSGGQGVNEIMPEAELMKRWLVAHGIEESRILTETKSVNTVENMAFSKKILPADCSSVGILTSNFHLFRAVRLAKACEIPVTMELGAPSAKQFLPHNLLREFFGVVKDTVMGNLW